MLTLRANNGAFSRNAISIRRLLVARARAPSVSSCVRFPKLEQSMAPTTRGSARASTSQVTLEHTNGVDDEDNHSQGQADVANGEDKVDAGITAIQVR